jgi:hypothetical protein
MGFSFLPIPLAMTLNLFLIRIEVQLASAMESMAETSSRSEERDGGKRAYGSHCGRDARAPMFFPRRNGERGRLARFVGLFLRA